MRKVDLIGSIDGGVHYQESHVAAILTADITALAYGSEFVGRPETRIYLGEKDVVKIRAELNFDKYKAMRWIRSALQKERELGVYHPCKTWFLIYDELDYVASSSVLIGSICPRLQPIHYLLGTVPDSREVRNRYLCILNAVFEKYLGLAKRLNVKLDEGLSNFGVDSGGEVFYLDDEYYGWDNFVSFAIMLGCYIRTLSWLDRDFTGQMALALSGKIDSIFEDPHCRVIIAEQLRSLFMPNEEKKRLALHLIDILMQFDKPVSSKSKAFRPPKSRYIALMADVHANYPALESVLAYLEKENIQEGIVLGDIVGYGPDPVQCIERLRDSHFSIIKGNHDHAVAIGKADNGFSQSAKAVIQWTGGQLADEHRNWLKYLPAVMENKEWIAVHGSPLDPAFFYGYVYLMTAEDNLDYLESRNRALCFHGHSHMPGIFARDKGKTDHHLSDTRVSFKPFKHILACPGSVGQPRNGHAGAQFAVYDREKSEMALITQPYNVEEVVHRMKRHNLPGHLWQRLLNGK